MLLTLLLSLLLPADQVIGGEVVERHRFVGAGAGELLGHAVAWPGDLDGDGVGDFVIGAPGASPAGQQGAGCLFIHSGRDGALLRRIDGPQSGDSMGFSIAAAGDLDHDGTPDLLAGGPNSSGSGGGRYFGTALVYSGSTGALLLRVDALQSNWQLGYSVDHLGDLDGDGDPDYVIGSPGAWSESGMVEVYSGRTGLALQQDIGITSGDRWGYSVSSTGDFDADGTPDYLAGSPLANSYGVGWKGRAVAYSGATGTPVYDFRGAPGASLGNTVAGAGDVDRDGHDDFLVSDPSAPPGTYCQGEIVVYSGATGTPILRVVGRPGDGLGSVADGGRDVNGDGTSDFAAVSVRTCPGTVTGSGLVQVYSGRDGSLILEIEVATPDSLVTPAIALGEDLDQDGLLEFLVGAPRSGSAYLPGAGTASLLGLDPYLTFDSTELSAGSGIPVHALLEFPYREGLHPYVLLASLRGPGKTTLNGLVVPLREDELFRRIRSGWAPPLAPELHGTLDPLGRATVPIRAIPAMTVHAGRRAWFAAVTYEATSPAPRATSIVRSLTLVP